MPGDILKVTRMNSRLSMRITDLLSKERLLWRWREEGEVFVRLGRGGKVSGAICSGRIEKSGVIHFVVVAEEERQKGLGVGLVNRVMAYYSGRCDRIFVLSGGEADPFFIDFGFERLTPNQAEEATLRSWIPDGYELNRLKLLRMRLPGRWPVVGEL